MPLRNTPRDPGSNRPQPFAMILYHLVRIPVYVARAASSRPGLAVGMVVGVAAVAVWAVVGRLEGWSPWNVVVVVSGCATLIGLVVAWSGRRSR